VQYLLGLDRRGTYVVRESVEKAPIHDHPCNLTRTAVKISFPEIKNEVFVNLLGYKGSDLIYLNRCKGVCMNNDERKLKCKAIGYQEKRVKMMVKAFRVGSDAREKVKDIILDDHTQCGCECGEELEAECAGNFNRVTCACECPLSKFGTVRDECLARTDRVWNSQLCFCESRSARGLPDHYSTCGSIETHDSSFVRVIADMVVWLALGSSVTLVLVLSWITRYYRNKYLKLQNATNGIDKIDEELYECQNDEDNKHITNSTTSGEFENVFPYRDQIEHFLTATRDLRKSRANSLENILENRRKNKSDSEGCGSYNHSHHLEAEAKVFYQPFVQQDIEVEEDQSFHENINV